MNRSISISRTLRSSNSLKKVYVASSFYNQIKVLSKNNAENELSWCLKNCRTCSELPRRYKSMVLIGQNADLYQNFIYPLYLSSQKFHLHLVLNQDKTDTQNSHKSKEKLENEDLPDKKLSLVQKFKLMYKQYWYVLIPVHLVTSAVWFGGFFFAAKSGVDIVPILESMGASEKILEYLRNSNAGYYGIAYALYKLATPARYTVTLGGTTISINYLKNRGYIKPVPTKEEMKVMYEDKRDELMEKREELREKYQERRDEFIEKYQDKASDFKDRYREKRNEFFDKYGFGKNETNGKKNR